MPATISGRARELLEQPNFGHIVTMRSDGTPHAAIVWVDLDGEQILVNSAEGRAWPTNLERDPRVLLTVADRENQYQYTQIEGRAVDHTTDGALEHADKLAMKYLGKDKYPFLQPGEVRVKFTIEAERVTVQGG